MWRRNALGGCYLVIGWSCLDQLAAEFGMSVISFERFLWRLDFVVGHVSIGKRMGEWSLEGRCGWRDRISLSTGGSMVCNACGRWSLNWLVLCHVCARDVSTIR